MPRAVPAFLLAALLATVAVAKMGSLTFDELVQGSDVIVIARVEAVSRPLSGKRYATARVIETWKGSVPERIEFLASPTWTCDISEAEKGETVLLFLAKGGESRSYKIAASGRGRMPLRTIEGRRYATYWPEVRLPEGTPTIDGPEPEFDFIRSVELPILRNLVR